jgi:hypothetical protein
MEFSREIHLDATPTLIINLNVLEQIIGSKPPHFDAPFSFPLGISSSNFESVHPPCFIPTGQLPFYYHLINPLDGIVLHYHCLGQVLRAQEG